MDIVILSNALDDSFKAMTQTAIDTALENRGGNDVKIIVMERQPKVSYKNVKTVNYTIPFNYNAVANLGVRMGRGEYILIASNDVVFYPNFLDELLKVKAPVMSPKCPMDGRQKDIMQNTEGYTVGKYFCGWCFCIRRDVFDSIGGMDEDFGFWYADNATVEQLKAVGVTPLLVVNSFVEHLGSRTLRTMPREEQDEITVAQADRFFAKYPLL